MMSEWVRQSCLLSLFLRPLCMAFVLWGIVVGACPPVVLAQASSIAEQQVLIKRALESFESGRYPEAEKQVRALLMDKTLSPNLTFEIRSFLVGILEKQPEKLAEAETIQQGLIQQFEPTAKTAEELQKLSDLYAHLGYIRSLQNHMPEAGESYRMAITYLVNALPDPAPSSLSASPNQQKLELILKNLSVIIYKLRTSQQADQAQALINGVDQALGYPPLLKSKHLVEIYTQAGLIQSDKQQHQEALTSFDQARALGTRFDVLDMPVWPAVLEGIGRSAYALGQYPKAVDAYKELLAYHGKTPVLSAQQLNYIQRQIKDLSSVDTSHDYFHLQGKDITRWNDKTKTITVCIPSGEANPLWKPAYNEALQQAFLEWQTALENRVQFSFTESPKKYDVKIIWADRKDASPVRLPNQTELGYNLTETWGEFMAKSDIYLYLDKGTESMSDMEFYKTSLHEIGHLLGIHVHSNNIEDVMFPTVHANQKISNHLSLRDIATMRRIYGVRPSISNPEGYYLSDFEKFRKKQMADLECQDAPIITLNFDMPGAYGGQQHQLVCRRKQRPQDQIPVWMPNFGFH